MTYSPTPEERHYWQPAFVLAGCLLFALLSPAAAGAATPGDYWKPQDPQAVIVSLPDADSSGAAMDRLRHQLRDDPANVALATHFATASLKHYAVNGDPRYLGYADGVLQHWTTDQAPPVSLWLLRGRLLQTQHKFEAAAEDLERLLDHHPGNAQALALAADARRRSGDLPATRRHCLNLQLNGYTSVAWLCAADTLLSLGDFERSMELARRTAVVEADASTPDAPEIRAWAWSVAGDAAMGLQQYDTAERAYSTAIEQLVSPPIAMRLALVDTYLEKQRHADAWSALQALPPSTAVLLRRAIVAKDYRPGELADLRAQLKLRFENSGDTELHWQDKALIALHLDENPSQAQAFARRNWELQKGWEDAELLIEASTAAGDRTAHQQVATWRQSQRATAP